MEDDDDDYAEYANVQEEATMTKEEKLAWRKYKSLKEYFDKYWLVPFWLRKSTTPVGYHCLRLRHTH